MVLEALDRIREAEDKVNGMRQAVKKEIRLYELKKSDEFKKRQEESQIKVTALLHELETQKYEQLQKEKEILLSEAKEQNQEFRQKYEKNKESIIDHIIERVKKIYGSH